MIITRRTFIACVLVSATLLALARIAVAGPYEDAVAAFDRHDYATTLRLVRPLAEHGRAEAQDYLGILYLNGMGVAEDTKTAVTWLRAAAVQGYTPAQRRLGHVYFSRTNDLAEAARWYRRAADQGDPDAQYELGALYENGFGVPHDYVEALKWSLLAVSRYPASETESRRLAGVNRDRQAAKLSAAQIAQAQSLARDWRPIPFQPTNADLTYTATMALQLNDFATAARVYKPLAEQGDAEAQTMLGQLYNVGRGVPRDVAQAVKWFRAAARQGEAGGQFSLGAAYESGQGAPKNLVLAYMWAELAATSGDSFAGEFAKSRDAIAAKLTAAQLAEAKARAIKCKAAKFKGCE